MVFGTTQNLGKTGVLALPGKMRRQIVSWKDVIKIKSFSLCKSPGTMFTTLLFGQLRVNFSLKQAFCLARNLITNERLLALINR